MTDEITHADEMIAIHAMAQELIGSNNDLRMRIGEQYDELKALRLNNNELRAQVINLTRWKEAVPVEAIFTMRFGCNSTAEQTLPFSDAIEQVEQWLQRIDGK